MNTIHASPLRPPGTCDTVTDSPDCEVAMWSADICALAIV